MEGPSNEGTQTVVVHWRDAIRRFVIYNRNSSRSQAGKGKLKLAEKDMGLIEQAMAVGVPLDSHVFSGVERGQVTIGKRKILVEAARYAAKHGLGILAFDLTRFLRSDEYDPKANPKAKPRADEFALLRSLTLGVPLATLLKPDANDRERREAAIRRSGRAGRPQSFDANKLNALVLFMAEGGEKRPTYQSAADCLSTSKTTIAEVLDYYVDGDGIRGRIKDVLLELSRLDAASRMALLASARPFGN